MIETIATIVEKKTIWPGILSLKLHCEKIAKTAKPGQFVHVLIENLTLRRPFSICEICDDNIVIGFQIKGKGTKQMSAWPIGKKINVLGPLGNGFSENSSNDNVLIIGGGIGCFALLELAKQTPNCQAILGFKTAKLIILEEKFKKHCNKLIICCDDGSQGLPGNITNPLEKILKTEKINKIAACGPIAMMKCAFEIAQKQNRNVKFEACLEQRMACGIGACLGCSVELKQNNKIVSAHVCSDGPVFDAREVFFN